MSITVRAAFAEDAAALAAVHRAGLPPGWSAEAFVPYIAADGRACHIAFAGDEPAGLTVMHGGGGEAEILTIAVEPRFQRQGVGSALMRTVIAWAENRGAHRLYLDVAEGNAPARDFYARFGFTVVARREHYYQGNRKTPEAALILRLDIGQT